MVVICRFGSRNRGRSSSLLRSNNFRCSYTFLPLGQVPQVVRSFEVFGEAGQGPAVDSANHVLAPALHGDQPRIAKLFEVKAEGRRDLYRSRNAATDISHSRTIRRAHIVFFINCHGAAAVTEELEYA